MNLFLITFVVVIPLRPPHPFLVLIHPFLVLILVRHFRCKFVLLHHHFQKIVNYEHFHPLFPSFVSCQVHPLSWPERSCRIDHLHIDYCSFASFDFISSPLYFSVLENADLSA
jgi:hypothetical protein